MGEIIGVVIALAFFLLIGLLSCIRQVNEYERGIKFTRGRFKTNLQPGWHFIWPVFQSFRKIDIRIKVIDVPEQEAITKDNVSVKINAVIYYNIFDASKAMLKVEDYNYAVTQLAQTTMRNIVGTVTLDELLNDREKISSDICKIVDIATDEWGVKIQNVELKDISLPDEMKRVIAKAAEAEREKTAVITKAAGELEASKNLAAAAQTLSSAPGALHLRTLATINDVSSDQSNTIIFAIPLEILRGFDGGVGEKVVKAIADKKSK